MYRPSEGKAILTQVVDPNDQLRFLKAFLILLEIIKPAVCTLMDLEIKPKGLSMKTFIQEEEKKKKLKHRKRFDTMGETSDMDLTDLCYVARKTKLLPREKGGDLLEDIIDIRNDLLHSPYPYLHETDYRIILQQYKGIARCLGNFTGKYRKYETQIDIMDGKIMNERQVQITLERYQRYRQEAAIMLMDKTEEEKLRQRIRTLKAEVEKLENQIGNLYGEIWKLNNEIKELVAKKLNLQRDSADTYTKDLAGKGANLTDFAPTQALFGAIGGTVGLVADMFTFGRKK